MGEEVTGGPGAGMEEFEAEGSDDENIDDELEDKDFEPILKELLDRYAPFLKENLELAEDPQRLEKEARKARSCEEEFAVANALFEPFFSEQNIVRLIPPEGREVLGPVESWRWCAAHLRCCVIFGWLVCRWPRTFRG